MVELNCLTTIVAKKLPDPTPEKLDWVELAMELWEKNTHMPHLLNSFLDKGHVY